MKRIIVILCFAALCIALGMSADSYRDAKVSMVSMSAVTSVGCTE